MATVTAIRQQTKNLDRFSIFLDGKYAFSLSARQLTENGLASGQELSGDEIEAYEGRSQAGKALQSAYRLLSYRSRSIKELSQRLERKGYDQATIDQVVERLKELGLLDDDDFASSWLAQPKSRQRSLRRLNQELRAKGVDKEAVEQNLAELPQDHERDAIRALIIKRRNKNTPVTKEQLLGYLVRQGFRLSLVLDVLNQDFTEVR